MHPTYEDAIYVSFCTKPIYYSIYCLHRYGDLEKEGEDLGVAKEPEVINLLSTLYPFAVDDVTTLPYVQVRLIVGNLCKFIASLQFTRFLGTGTRYVVISYCNLMLDR